MKEWSNKRVSNVDDIRTLLPLRLDGPNALLFTLKDSKIEVIYEIIKH